MTLQDIQYIFLPIFTLHDFKMMQYFEDGDNIALLNINKYHRYAVFYLYICRYIYNDFLIYDTCYY